MTTTTTYTVGQVVEVDPKTLTIGPNVRLDTYPKATEFAASIKARGVIEVITAHVDEDANLVACSAGQRRTLAAVDVGTPSGTVPVRIVEPPEESDRIIDQMTENIHRAAMQENEVRDGVEQLALLGVSAAQIAKRTAVKRETVDAALTVVGSDATRKGMDTQGLTLAQAAALAEVEDDETATARLTRSIEWATPSTTRCSASETSAPSVSACGLRLSGCAPRAFRPSTRTTAPRRANCTGCGWTASSPRRVRRSPTSSARTCPGSPSSSRSNGSSPRTTLRTTRTTRKPKRRARRSTCTRGCAPTRRPPDCAPATSPVRSSPPLLPRGSTLPRRRLRPRRSVRSAAACARTTPHGAAPRPVRREWLASFVTRKTPPKGAEAIICEAMITAPHSITRAMQNSHPMLRAVLGSESKPGLAVATECANLATQPATAKALTMRTLATVLLAWEDSTDVHTWRNPGPWDRRVMTALTGWGYEASEVEQLLTATDEDEAAA